MFVKSLFKLMADAQASDLFFTAGAPIQIKIKGEVVPVDQNLLDAPMLKKIAYEAMTEEQIAAFRARARDQLLARSRRASAASASTSSGSAARARMVIRHIKVGHSDGRGS